MACTTHCITKATPIRFINDKCYIKQLKAEKSRKTCLTNHTWPISHHIMPLVINAHGADTQTDRQTHIDTRTKTISRNLARVPKVPGLKTCDILCMKFMHVIDWCGFVNCLRWQLLNNAMYHQQYASEYVGSRFLPELYPFDPVLLTLNPV